LYSLCYSRTVFGYGLVSEVFSNINDYTPPGYHHRAVYHDCLPMVYPRIVTKPRILTALVYTWFISQFVSLIQLSWYTHEWKQVPSLPNEDLIHDIFCVAIIVLLPLIFMIYAHIHILVVARQQVLAIKRQTFHLWTAKQKTEKKNAQLIYVAMLGVFIAG